MLGAVATPTAHASLCPLAWGAQTCSLETLMLPGVSLEGAPKSYLCFTQRVGYEQKAGQCLGREVCFLPQNCGHRSQNFFFVPNHIVRSRAAALQTLRNVVTGKIVPTTGEAVRQWTLDPFRAVWGFSG